MMIDNRLMMDRPFRNWPARCELPSIGATITGGIVVGDFAGYGALSGGTGGRSSRIMVH